MTGEQTSVPNENRHLLRGTTHALIFLLTGGGVWTIWAVGGPKMESSIASAQPRTIKYIGSNSNARRELAIRGQADAVDFRRCPTPYQESG